MGLFRGIYILFNWYFAFFFFYEDHIFLITVASVLNLEDGQPQSSNIVILC